MKRICICITVLLVAAGCDRQTQSKGDGSAPVRGLVATMVEAAEKTTLRRYPGVLEPKDITSLSFEVAGKLDKLDLTVGQRVAKGEVLARLDSEQFETDIEKQAAAVTEMAATLTQAKEDLGRAEKLLKKGVVTKVRRDTDRTKVRTSQAQLVQAEKALATAKEALQDTVILAPFDGIINSVDADSFSTLSAGTVVTSIYDATSFEVSFSVNFDTISRLVVGTPAKVRLADDPEVALAGVVSELGERADTVSSFPVIVELKDSHPLIKAGMAIEVSFEFNLPAERGYLIPISAAIAEGQIPAHAGPTAVVPVGMFVYDPDTGTVKRREVLMAGLRENQFLIIDGLNPGEHVATAGVSFLREGMKVKLLAPHDRPGE